MSASGQVPHAEREHYVRPLLAHLAEAERALTGQWGRWKVEPIAGGWSNLLYRVTDSTCDLAVKFTVRDERDRAGREHAALLALQEAGLALAPQPWLLDRDSYRQPVVVMTWLEGQVNPAPPATDEEWRQLVRHLASIHSLTPRSTAVDLPQAVLNAYSVRDGQRIVQQEAARVPHQTQPQSLQALLGRFAHVDFPSWADAPAALCRVDHNTLNFIRRPGLWASVDWENAGWGDPAFDIADCMTHAAYLDVPLQRWEWVVAAYASLVDDLTVTQRIWVYYQILLVWWVARLARYLYEVPRGLDPRLVQWPESRRQDLQAKYEHYLALAERVCLPSALSRGSDTPPCCRLAARSAASA